LACSSQVILAGGEEMVAVCVAEPSSSPFVSVQQKPQPHIAASYVLCMGGRRELTAEEVEKRLLARPEYGEWGRLERCVWQELLSEQSDGSYMLLDRVQKAEETEDDDVKGFLAFSRRNVWKEHVAAVERSGAIPTQTNMLHCYEAGGHSFITAESAEAQPSAATRIAAELPAACIVQAGGAVSDPPAWSPTWGPVGICRAQEEPVCVMVRTVREDAALWRTEGKWLPVHGGGEDPDTTTSAVTSTVIIQSSSWGGALAVRGEDGSLLSDEACMALGVPRGSQWGLSASHGRHLVLAEKSQEGVKNGGHVRFDEAEDDDALLQHVFNQIDIDGNQFISEDEMVNAPQWTGNKVLVVALRGVIVGGDSGEGIEFGAFKAGADQVYYHYAHP
jgi:hypothetical protein